ncbi:MAG: DNA polymerase III subunit beta [Proteobacteria bacterium]|nr:DNA polymerase III subunit beta [Pseudomonadota bacterium]
MRLIIERSALLKALTHVASVVERRNTIPILSNVLISAKGKTVSLTATDLDIEVVETAPAEVSQDGGTTVSAHMLHDIVRKLSEGAQVELSLGPDEDRMALISGPAKFAIQALPVDDFPDLSAGEMSHAFTMPAADMKRLLDKTRFAISTEETRYYLNGIYLHAAENNGKQMLRSVATDGHRLAQMDIELPKGADGMPGIIVPRKTVSELHKLLEDSDAKLKVELSTSKIRFSLGDVVLTSQLIDGTFPDYGRVIPEGNDKALNVSNEEFARAVDRVSTLSSDKGRAVKLKAANGKLVLSVNNPESGSATEELSADYTSEDIEIGFNARYLLDISAQLESKTVKFLLSDPGSPIMVHDDGATDALYVLMPMRV